MRYKNYTGSIEIDEEDGILHGRVLGIRDVVNYQGKTVEEVRKAFQESVDCYLALCTRRGEPPEKPYSGKFVVRIEPSTHREMTKLAEAHGQSLNAMMDQAAKELIAALRKVELPPTNTTRSKEVPTKAPSKSLEAMKSRSSKITERRRQKVETQKRRQKVET